MSILEKNSKLDPFFHKMTVEKKWEKNMILSKENENIGKLYDIEYKIYHYYNEKGEIKKTISKPINKKFIKEVVKTEYDGKFQENCQTLETVSDYVTVFSFVGCIALCAFCPPAALGALAIEYIAGGIGLGSAAAKKIKDEIEYLSNKEFNEQTVINELLIEDEENF